MNIINIGGEDGLNIAYHGLNVPESKTKFIKKIGNVFDEVINDVDIELNQRMCKAFAIANNAIYFSDSSDYLTALWNVCKCLQPENEEIGEQYINEN